MGVIEYELLLDEERKPVLVRKIASSVMQTNFWTVLAK